MLLFCCCTNGQFCVTAISQSMFIFDFQTVKQPRTKYDIHFWLGSQTSNVSLKLLQDTYIIVHNVELYYFISLDKLISELLIFTTIQ